MGAYGVVAKVICWAAIVRWGNRWCWATFYFKRLGHGGASVGAYGVVSVSCELDGDRVCVRNTPTTSILLPHGFEKSLLGTPFTLSKTKSTDEHPS